MKKTYQPTEAVQKNVSKALAIKSKYKIEDTSLSNLSEEILKGSVSLASVKAMYQALSDTQPKVDIRKKTASGAPQQEYLQTLELGGNAGLAWCRRILKGENILKSYKKEITDEEVNTEDKTEIDSIPIAKAVNEELKQATFVVLVPDEVDLHGDTYSSEEVRKAAHSFNQYCGKANLLHLVETNSFSFVESYIAPADMVVGETYVKKGSWLAVTQFHDDDVWEGVKSGEYTGLSIGAKAFVQNLEENDG